MRRASILLALIITTLLVSMSKSDTCGGNCPTGKCPNCFCGQTKLIVDIAAWCSKYTGWDQSCCKCIAAHESGGNAHQ